MLVLTLIALTQSLPVDDLPEDGESVQINVRDPHHPICDIHPEYGSNGSLALILFDRTS